MKKIAFLVIAMVAAGIAEAGSIPAEITYQGSLKKSGIPANGDFRMSFDLMSQDLGTLYWTSKDVLVHVSSGLFSVLLKPVLTPGTEWQNIQPYLRVSVEGQVLGPAEPITSTIYATVSGSVVDKSISQQKIDTASFEGAGIGFVPPGAIMMFDTSCPKGWSAYSSLNNRFPMGSDTPGSFGGYSSHTHLVNAHTHSLPDHTHGVSDSNLKVGIGIRNIGYDNNLAMMPSISVGAYSSATNGEWWGYGLTMSHPAPFMTNPGNVAVQGPKIWGSTELGGSGESGSATSTTDVQQNIPPYQSVLFCKKL